jgi:hypothetical protein
MNQNSKRREPILETIAQLSRRVWGDGDDGRQSYGRSFTAHSTTIIGVEITLILVEISFSGFFRSAITDNYVGKNPESRETT